MAAWLARLARRPAFWILLYGGLIAYGLAALNAIPVEVLPPFDFPQISVIIHDPGATATQLETLIVRPLEDRILTLQDVTGVRSTMGHGTVEIDVRFRQGGNAQTDLQAVQMAINRARAELPAGVRPLAEIIGNAINEVADYVAAIPPGVAPGEVERDIRTRITPALRALPGVWRAEVYGTGDEALWIQPDLPAMRRYGVSVAAIIQAIKARVLLDPGGYLALGHQHVLIEVRDLPTQTRILARTPVKGLHGSIPLGAIARIVRSPVPTQNAVLLDGHPGIALTVFKQAGASTMPVTRAVQRTLAETAGQLPKGVHWVQTYSQGHLVRLIGGDLGRDLLVGAGLAILVLIFVLGAGRGIWTLALSIPLSLLLGIAGLYAAGQSLNLMTLGALTVAAGLLADDAIIVLESIYHRWEQGDERWVGIRRGLVEIAGPDVTGTLSTVAVYIPLLFVGGLAGLFFLPFALAMTLALLASLFISLSLIPLGLGFLKAQTHETPTLGGRLLEQLRQANTRLLDLAIRHPRFGLVSCVVLLLLCLAGLAFLPVSFLPLPNEGVLLESFTLPPGSSLAETEEAVQRMTSRLRADPLIAHTFARIGSPASSGYTEPTYAGEIQIVLRPGVAVNSLDAISRHLITITRLPGVQTSIDTPTVERLGESLSGLPQPFVIHLYGNNIRELRTISERIAARLRQIPALSEIFDNDGYPVTQLQIVPKPAALDVYGLTAAALYAQIRPLLAGDVITKVPDGGIPLALYIRLAGAPELTLGELARLPIRTDGWTPLGQLATIRLLPTPNQIRHIDGARALDILATPTGSPGAAIRAAKAAIAEMHLPSGYRVGFGGLDVELETTGIRLAIAIAVSLVLMIAILVLQFEGALVPGLLLLQIPLAFTGGAFALIISGVGLNGIAMIAVLTLVGISLNHGIVLLDRARRNEAAGMATEAATREAVAVRFRPIMLTTLTAVSGALPTAFGWGEGAAPEQGLALVILGGIAWSALLSTNLIPALYIHRRRRHQANQPGRLP